MYLYLKEVDYKTYDTFSVIINTNELEIVLDRLLYAWYQSYIGTKKNNNNNNQILLTFKSTFKSVFTYLFKYLSNYYSLLELNSIELKTDDELLYSLIIKDFLEIRNNCLIEENQAYIKSIIIDGLETVDREENYAPLTPEQLKLRREKHLQYIEYRVRNKQEREARKAL